MPNPYGGEVRDGAPYGLPGKVVLGKGLSEQKAPLAAILLALQSILAANVSITGQVVFLCCVSGETGRHDAIKSIIERTGLRAEMAILNGTGNRISLGNRGRVDVTVTVHGNPGIRAARKAPANAITGALEVVRPAHRGPRSRRATPGARQGDISREQDPELSGHRHTQFRIQRAKSGVDRRLMPGEDPDKGSRRHRGDCRDRQWNERSCERQAVARRGDQGPIHVSASGHPRQSNVVTAVMQASQSMLGVSPETFHQTNAFDQGYLQHIGIEPCTYGPGEGQYAHTDLDMASVDRTRDAAKVYAAMILQRLT